MFVRARISLRRQRGRQPTVEEVKMEMETAGHDFKATVSAEDINNAYDVGDEVRSYAFDKLQVLISIFANKGYCGVVHEMRWVRWKVPTRRVRKIPFVFEIGIGADVGVGHSGELRVHTLMHSARLSIDKGLVYYVI